METVEPQSDGIFAGILNILKKPKPHIEVREALGAKYGAIIAAKPNSAADWRGIAALAGRYGDIMLLPQGMVPPPPLQEAECPRFARRLLLGTAVEIVKRTRMPMYRRIVGLVDENGEYADFLFDLLHHYTTVKVLSGRRALYQAQADRMMEELGAPVILCDDYASFFDCVLVVAPDGLSTDLRMSCPVLGKSGGVKQGSDFITNLRYVPDAEQAKQCPAGIEPHRFFAALYEYGGAAQIGSVASRMTFRSAETDLTRVVHAVMQASGALSIF